MVISTTAIMGLICLTFLKEPEGHMAEVDENGSVELISVT